MGNKNFISFSFKRFITTLVILILVSFSVSGCRQRDTANQLLNSKDALQQGQLSKDSASNAKNSISQSNIAGTKNSSASSKNTASASSSNLTNASKLLDSLDNSLSNTNNSSDLKDTELIINNIN